MMKHLAFLLLLSLAAVKDGSAETALRAKTPSYSASHQRRELSVGDWWYTLLNLLHVPCDPHHSEEHPHGHCAHHSHHPPKKSGGSHSSSSSSSSGSAYCQYTCDDCDGSSSDCSCHKCSDVCQETCDGSSSSCVMCESVPECSDDCVENDGSGCVSCSSGYSPDGWTGDEWTGDGATTDTTSASWGGDAWQASYSKQNDGSSGSGKAAFWGIGAGLCALVAGAALFMTRKRNESDEQARAAVPRDVYVREGEDDEDYYGAQSQASYANEEPKASASRSSFKKMFTFGRKSTKNTDGALV